MRYKFKSYLYIQKASSLRVLVMQTAVKVVLWLWFSAITQLTYFEICVLCKAQNRGARPWLAPVSPQATLLTPGGGILLQ